VDDGLPQSSVTCLSQTPDGYLWVGTRNGLARFDGVRFVSYRPATTPALGTGRIAALHADKQGELWVATEGSGLSVHRGGWFLNLLPEHTPAQSSMVIRPVFFESASNHLWISLDRGRVHYWDGAALREVLAPAECADDNLIPVGNAPGGGMWFWVQQQMELYRLDGRAWTRVAERWDLLGRRCVAWAWGQDGALWIATENEIAHWTDNAWRAVPGGELETGLQLRVMEASLGASVWVEVGYRLRRFQAGKWVADTGRLPTGPGATAARWTDRDGDLWLSFQGGGLFRIKPDGAWYHFTGPPGGPMDEILCGMEDREGNVWAGCESVGLVRLQRRVFTVLDTGAGTKWHPPLSLCCDAQGALWLGTQGGGLRRVADGQYQQFHFGLDASPGSVWTVYADRQGGLWAGTWDNGLFRKEGDTFVRACEPARVNGQVLALHQDQAGALWLGNDHGLYRWANGEISDFTRQAGLPPHEVRAIAEDKHGRIWCGGRDGLYCLNGGSFERHAETNGGLAAGIGALYVDAEDTLWVGGLAGVLSAFRQGRWFHFGSCNGLRECSICSLIDDDLGYLWMSTSSGILRAQKRGLTAWETGRTNEVVWQQFDRADGLPNRECSGGFQPAVCKTAQGRLWFPTVNGVVSVDPSQVETNPIRPPVRVEEVWVNGVRLDGEDNPGNRTLAGKAPALRIGPGVERLEFRYTGLSFVATERVRFRCQLEPLNSVWEEAGVRRVASYSHLPPGPYTFRVRACNNTGLWSDRDAQFAFTVRSYFWETTWFRLGLGAACATGIAGGVFWASRRRLHRKLERLRAQQALQQERLRIAHDIHDDVGASLTRISLLSQAALEDTGKGSDAKANLGRIYETTRSLTGTLDEIVWAINPSHDTLESLATFFAEWASEFLEPDGVSLRLDIPLQLPHWAVTSEVRHSLFLAFKEALNNAMKHAQASEVAVALQTTARGIVLSIQDNGCGFDVAARTLSGPAAEPDAGRNGLASMKRRMAQAGGVCTIESAPGQGTLVSLVIDLVS
jgi:signal transduction histidine kinase/ligand-binding sensor domain-containing protein